VQPATDNIMPRAVIALTLGRTRRVLLKPV
jgi:hypothetical protein